MMGRDLHNNITLRTAIPPISISTNVATLSAIVDRQGYESLEFLILTGLITSGTAAFALAMTHGESPTLADGVAVDPTLILGSTAGASFTFSNPSSQFRLGYIGGKRFVQLSITSSANAAAALLAAVAILGAPAKAPTP
jgi:hypothetical protein